MPVGAAIGIGTSVASHYIKSHQQKKAADALIAAQNKGLETQAKMYDQTRQDLNPFRQGGQAAFGKLGEFLGLPAPGPDTAARQGPTPPSADQTAIYGGMDPRSKQFVTDPSQIQTPGMPGYAAATTEAPGVNFTPGRPPVMMRAPDGSTKQVPGDQVAHYQALGAQRLS